MPRLLRIGELAQAVGVPISTVRYYERRGLVRPTARSEGNYRLYDPESVSRLRFVRSAQRHGFSLADVERLLALRDATAPPCAEVQALIEHRLAEVEAKLRELEGLRLELRRAERLCRENAPKGRCEVLRSLLPEEQ